MEAELPSHRLVLTRGKYVEIDRDVVDIVGSHR